MLTRLIKVQLVIFTIVSIIGVLVMVFTYIQAPTLLGVGRLTVKLELPTSGGLYRFSNVTYRGVEVGKVTGVELTADGAEATMSIATSPKIPADLKAEVRSVSAVGEQYVDLRPQTDSGPYLRDGAVITAADVGLPQPVGPVLDRVNTLVNTFPKDKLSDLLDETYKGFNGASDDFGSLLDSGATVSADLNGVADQARTLATDSRPLLASQADTADSIRTWARSLAGFTGQLAADDPQFRTVLQKGPALADEVSGLLGQIKPTLPVLLANLGTVSEILMTYNASLEQLLVLLPPYVAQQQAYSTSADSTGTARGDFAATVSDPPPCTVGFLPPSSWRSPDDLSDIDTPDGIYCKLPQDSPVAVRGARNYPCIRKPGKRAPTVAICNSDKPFIPLAMRQHGLGPYPIDPSLIAQGIPIDDRTTLNDDIHAPVGGTPLPPGAVPLGTPPGATPRCVAALAARGALHPRRDSAATTTGGQFAEWATDSRGGAPSGACARTGAPATGSRPLGGSSARGGRRDPRRAEFIRHRQARGRTDGRRRTIQPAHRRIRRVEWTGLQGDQPRGRGATDQVLARSDAALGAKLAAATRCGDSADRSVDLGDLYRQVEHQ